MVRPNKENTILDKKKIEKFVSMSRSQEQKPACEDLDWITDNFIKNTDITPSNIHINQLNLVLHWISSRNHQTQANTFRKNGQ